MYMAGLRHIRRVRPNRAADFRGGRLFGRAPALDMYRARQKNTSLGKIRYLWNCCRFLPNLQHL